MSHLLFFSLLFSFFWFFISIAAQSIPFNYPTCPSYMSCGNINISYPFWRIGDDQGQSQHCGYVGFGINCSTINDMDFPVIDIDGVSYYVEKIVYPLTSIVLVDYDVSPIVPVRNYCRMVPHNIDFQSLPFNFTEFNVNLSFHFNCTEIPDFASEIRQCSELNSGRGKSCINVMNLEPVDFDWSSYSCDEEVVKTVLNSTLPDGDRLEREYGDVLSRGFELKWERLEGCDKCEDSDGRCGYNNSTAESMCFCSDGRTTKDNCKKNKGINWRLKLVIGFGAAILSLMSIIYCIMNSPSSICISTFKHKTEDEKSVEAFIMQYGSLGTKRYPYVAIKKMTNSFKVELGKGGFGTVF